MHSGSQQCLNVVPGHRPFTALTRVQIPPGTPYKSMHYESAPMLQKEASVAGATCRGFAPAPPGFSAFVPLPIRTFCEQIAKGGCRSIPLDRSRPLSRRSGCLPAWALPSAQSGLILLPADEGTVGSKRMTLTLRESGPAEESPSPQGGTQHAE